jgi:hypothetical protein
MGNWPVVAAAVDYFLRPVVEDEDYKIFCIEQKTLFIILRIPQTD